MTNTSSRDRAWFENPTVAVSRVAPVYLPDAPFHPGTRYPEAPFEQTSERPNAAYAGVRSALASLGLDPWRFDSSNWNPLAEIVRPGDHVLLKPNLIRESHQQRENEWEQVVTHCSVVRAVLDYVVLASSGDAWVTIADGPQTDSDFAAIRRRTGLDQLAEFYAQRGVRVNVIDLRRERWFDRGGVIEKRVSLPGDPAGYTRVDLGDASEFSSYDKNGRFYGADYDIAETAHFHTEGRHEYVLCRTAMDADVVINIPKLKTHKKVGVTLSLKNFVGINGYRNCLPHHTLGTVDLGGDEFATAELRHKLQSRAIVAFKRALVARGGNGNFAFRMLKLGGRVAFGDTQRVVRSGNWHGNDTAWRMVLDLNKAFFYHDGEGRPRDGRRYLSIVDGIVGGEGNGPAAPDAKASGIVVAGFSPVAVDTVCAALMGFDYTRIPMLARAWTASHLPLVGFSADETRCVSNVDEWRGDLASLARGPDLGFRPHFGWKGWIERERHPAVARQRGST